LAQRSFITLVTEAADPSLMARIKERYGKRGATLPTPDPEAIARDAAAAKAAEASFDAVTAQTIDQWAAGRTVILDFSAEWCGPCRDLAPRLKAAADRVGLKVGRVDVDEEPELKERFDVVAFPTVLLLRDHQEGLRLIGSSRSEDEIVAEFEAAMNG
jgi:thiol-disulfide isomerase/thioredoxin